MRPYLSRQLNNTVGFPALWQEVPDGREYVCDQCREKKSGKRYVKTELSSPWQGGGTLCPACRWNRTTPSQDTPHRQPTRRTLPT